ncbi:hypothetical protein AMJ50_00195 [Parcubacteria bacterium DG_74_3]|nr:MAG: hypothetical protein AMJ50_00195 [Parcubacteria bacterium DG_74_3]
MPRGDRTGPMGLGPMTGRGFGYCAGYPHPGYMNPIGRGWGRGMAWRRGWGGGWGRGWRRGWDPYWGYPDFPYSAQPPTAKEEKEMLKEEKEILSEELKALRETMKAIEERIRGLEKKK